MTAYTPEEDDMLRALYAEGKSFSQIGKAMGRTKGSAISRSRKLKLKPRGNDHIRRMAARSVRIRNARKEPQPRRQKMETAVSREVPYLPIPDESRLASIVDVTGCKWPVRDDAEFIGGIACCNHSTAEGASYCEYHAVKSAARNQPKPITSIGPIGLRFEKRAA